jgi:hypothetical protein
MSSPYVSGSSWSWPKEVPSSSVDEQSHIPGTFDADENPPDVLEDEHNHEANPSSNEAPKAQKPQKHYPPRTCRICLEVVQPTFETPLEGLPGILAPAPEVVYISDDPESGRLIRPCKCKGSQLYVHEGCLQQWRHSDAAYGRRNYFECPTCKFQYRLERMAWSRWISSTSSQIALTLLILFFTVFILGFVADPIINLYLDPVGTLTTNPLTAEPLILYDEDEETTWVEHIIKGLASLGLLGFAKVLFAMSPWQWWNIRGVVGGRGRRANTGRGRIEAISWHLVLIGILTFLWVCLSRSQ